MRRGRAYARPVFFMPFHSFCHLFSVLQNKNRDVSNGHLFFWVFRKQAYVSVLLFPCSYALCRFLKTFFVEGSENEKSLDILWRKS